MEPHSWIIAIAGMAYLYYLSQIYDKRRVYLIKKSRIHQPQNQNDEEIDLWRKQFEEFQRELKAFRIKSIFFFMVIPVLEMFAHNYFGEHVLHIWWIPMLMFLIFLIGLLVLVTEMSGPQPLNIQKLDKRSLLYN